MTLVPSSSHPSGGANPALLGFSYHGTITHGTTVSIPGDGSDTDLSWIAAPSGAYPGQTALLNLTAPTNPSILVDGIYDISVEASVFPGGAGGVLVALLFLDTDGINDGPGQYLALASPAIQANPSCSRYLTAGMKLKLTVEQTSGGALNVGSWMQIQRTA